MGRDIKGRLWRTLSATLRRVGSVFKGGGGRTGGDRIDPTFESEVFGTLCLECDVSEL